MTQAIDRRGRKVEINGARVIDPASGRDAPGSIFIADGRIAALPNVTCGRITLWPPSATPESISTPRFIGPGCITIASRLASASFSAVSP